MKLSGGRHDLDLADDVDNGVTAQYLSCYCKWKRGQNIIYTQYILRESDQALNVVKRVRYLGMIYVMMTMSSWHVNFTCMDDVKMALFRASCTHYTQPTCGTVIVKQT